MTTKAKLERALDERIIEPAVYDELIAALADLVADWESVDPDVRVPDEMNINEHWDAARNAIARAKGERG